MWSEVNQTKINTIWFNLYVESKNKSKQNNNKTLRSDWWLLQRGMLGRGYEIGERDKEAQKVKN